MKIGFLPLLGLIFITLKLTGVIDWAWVWVLLPIWVIPAVFASVIIGIAIKSWLDLRKIEKEKRRMIQR